MLSNSNADIREPTEDELKSRNLAELVCYVVDTGYLEGWYDPVTIEKYRLAANNPYGGVEHIEGMSSFLKKLPGHLREEHRNIIIYDGRNRMARRLAEWLEENMESETLYRRDAIPEDEGMKKIKPFLNLNHSSAAIIREFLTTFLEVMDRKAFMSYREGMEAVIRLCKNEEIRHEQRK